MTITAEQSKNAKAHNHENVMSEWHTVRLHRDTMSKIHRLGRFKESYSEAIDRIASEALGLTLPVEEGSW
jgi:hypothetical protein